MEKDIQVINEVFGFDGSIYDIPEENVKNKPKQEDSKKDSKD